MGYWIGKRVCEAYYAKAGDKRAAMRTGCWKCAIRSDPRGKRYGREFGASAWARPGRRSCLGGEVVVAQPVRGEIEKAWP